MEQNAREKRSRWLRDLLCGALIGAGAILPGVSGGVLAVVFDVYRPVMETLTHPVRGLRKYWPIFLPLGIGSMVGFLGLAKAIAAAYALSAAATVWLFIGLIAGTFPALWREAGKEGHSPAAWVSCAVCALAVFMTLFYIRHVLHVTVTPNFWWYNFCGALWGAGIAIPGFTSSSIMMSLGLYEPIMRGLADMRFLVLSACLPGLLLTMALLARGSPRALGHCGSLHAGQRAGPVRRLRGSTGRGGVLRRWLCAGVFLGAVGPRFAAIK